MPARAADPTGRGRADAQDHRACLLAHHRAESLPEVFPHIEVPRNQKEVLLQTGYVDSEGVGRCRDTVNEIETQIRETKKERLL